MIRVLVEFILYIPREIALIYFLIFCNKIVEGVPIILFIFFISKNYIEHYI